METIHKLSLLLALLLIGPLRFFAADVAPEAEAAFIGKLKDACARRDVDAVLALYYWSGASEETKRGYRPIVEDLLQHSISNVRIVPAKGPQLKRFSGSDGTIYQPSLPQVRTVEFLFQREDGKEPGQASWGFPLGIKDGKLQIIANVPKPE